MNGPGFGISNNPLAPSDIYRVDGQTTEGLVENSESGALLM
jgi:hypothetical protein